MLLFCCNWPWKHPDTTFSLFKSPKPCCFRLLTDLKIQGLGLRVACPHLVAGLDFRRGGMNCRLRLAQVGL